MTCKELVELVTDYLEGTLPADDRARFEAHLTTCAGCTNYLHQMKEMLRLAGKLYEKDVSQEAQTELLSVFNNWKSPDA